MISGLIFKIARQLVSGVFFLQLILGPGVNTVGAVVMNTSNSGADSISVTLQTSNCMIPVGANRCASTFYLVAPAGKYYSIRNFTRNITTSNLLNPTNYGTTPGSSSPAYSVSTHPTGDAANYATYGINDLGLYEGTSSIVVKKATMSAGCASGSTWNGTLCKANIIFATGGALACTDVIRFCDNGSTMPRDANCGWHPEQCGTSSGGSGVIATPIIGYSIRINTIGGVVPTATGGISLTLSSTAIFQSEGTISIPEPSVARYEGYTNGKPFIRASNYTKVDALSDCMLHASGSQMNKKTRCLWDGVEIYPNKGSKNVGSTYSLEINSDRRDSSLILPVGNTGIWDTKRPSSTQKFLKGFLLDGRNVLNFTLFDKKDNQMKASSQVIVNVSIRNPVSGTGVGIPTLPPGCTTSVSSSSPICSSVQSSYTPVITNGIQVVVRDTLSGTSGSSQN